MEIGLLLRACALPPEHGEHTVPSVWFLRCRQLRDANHDREIGNVHVGNVGLDEDRVADLPVFCTLSPDTIKTRRAALLPGLVDRAESREGLPTGYRLRFVASSEILAAITATIDAERQCCRFLTFTVTVAPDGGPMTLDLSGPSGTREFLDSLFGRT